MKRLIALLCCIPLLSGCAHVTFPVVDVLLLLLIEAMSRGSQYECRNCEPNLPPETDSAPPVSIPMGEK